MSEPNDTRTMRELANAAIRVQDACNLSGVVHSFSRDISRLRVLLRESGRESTQDVNTHPICVLWTDKMRDLASGIIRVNDGSDPQVQTFSRAYNDCCDLAGS